MATTMAAGAPVERFFAVDDGGVGLRVTWRPAHGFVNVSLWDGGTCVQAFHLTPAEAGRLTAFLATSLMGAVPAPAANPLRLVARGDGQGPSDGDRRGLTARLLERVRRRLPRP